MAATSQCPGRPRRWNFGSSTSGNWRRTFGRCQASRISGLRTGSRDTTKTGSIRRRLASRSCSSRGRRSRSPATLLVIGSRRHENSGGLAHGGGGHPRCPTSGCRCAPAAARRGGSLKPPARVDAVFTSLSFAPTDAGIVTMADLARALRARDTEALSRAWRLRNRRHWSELK